MTEFHRVPDEVHSSGAFALPRSPAGGPTGGLCHSTRFTSGPTAPSAFATSARRVLQVLPGLLDLTTYPNPMSILARRRAQPKHQEPPDGVLQVASPCPHIEAGESKPLRNAFFNRRGRSSSMTNFNASATVTRQEFHQSSPRETPAFRPVRDSGRRGSPPCGDCFSAALSGNITTVSYSRPTAGLAGCEVCGEDVRPVGVCG